MAIRLSTLILVGSLAACGASVDKDEDISPMPADQTVTESAKTSPSTSDEVNLAECSDPKENSGENAKCVIEPSDGSGILLEVSYGAGSDGIIESPITVGIMSEQGTLVQTIEEPAETFYSRPKMQDLDMDGRADLLVPLYTGNVNTVYAVWHGVTAEPPFVRAGEISGIGIDTHLDGLFSVPARSSAASWENTYYKIKDSKLVEIAIMSTELNLDGSTETCTVSDAGGLGMIGLTLEEAQTKFCAEE